MMARRTARRSFAYVVMVSSVAAACNLISGLDKDFELAAGPSFPDVIDGEEGGVDSSSPSGRDGAGNDGGPSPPDWCKEQFDELRAPDAGFFCDTFERTEEADDVAAPPFGWTRHQRSGGGQLELVPDAGVAASAALRSELEAGAGQPGGGWVSVLWQDLCRLESNGKSSTLSFRFNVVNSTLDYAVLGAIQVKGGGEYGIAIYKGNASCSSAGTTAICLDENDPGEGHNFNGAVQLTKNKWYVATIQITRTGTNLQGQIRLDAEGTTSVLHDGPPAGSIQDAGSSRQFEVGVGTFFASPNGYADVLIDNVVSWCEGGT